VARRELRGDPANPQTRRRASGDDPRVRPPREPKGLIEPDLPPRFVGVKLPCPVCLTGIWAHQIREAQGHPPVRGAPGRTWAQLLRRQSKPMVGKCWMKNPHSGARGTYWEWEPANAKWVAESERWLAQQMTRWLSERDQLPGDASVGRLTEELQLAERVRDSVLAELIEVKDQLAMLQAEYARLRAETRTEQAAANPRWTVTDSYNVDWEHVRLARQAAVYRDSFEETRALHQDNLRRALSYPRKQYAESLTRFEEATVGCSKACCAQRDAMLADLQALKSSERG